LQIPLVPVPSDKAIQDVYLSSSLTHAEYPNLVAPGETVPTVAASALLMLTIGLRIVSAMLEWQNLFAPCSAKIDQLQQPIA
jgi:hypothetical protein